MRRRGRVLGGVVVTLGLLGAACGGDDGTPESAGSVDEGVRSEVQSQLDKDKAKDTGKAATGGEARPLPKTVEELEPFWEAERQAVIDRITKEGWGIDEATNTLEGPAGFTVDLNNCPQAWSNTEGITDTDIKIGAHVAQSGTLADYGNMARAWQVYIDYVNANGGIPDVTGKTRKVTLVTKDDAYDPARAIPLVDELLDSERVFYVFGGGSAAIMRTYGKMNERCVPHPFVWTGHPAWGDPVNHPWTLGSILNYYTEAILWGSYIERTLPKGVTVAGLVMNNDFGAAYSAGFRAFMAQSDHDITFEFETIEPTAPTVKNEMTTLAAKNPDVFIAMTAGTSCTQAITEAAENGMAQTAKQLWMPSVCKPLSFVGQNVVGNSSDGWLIAGGGVIDINDPAFQDKPGIQFATKLLRDANIDPKSSSNLSAGFYLGWPQIELLRIASQLPGGLSRTNYLLAMRAMDMTSPFMLDGLRLVTNGNEDAYVVEGSEFARFDAAKQTWVQEGEIIDLAGASDPCSWDQSAATCR